MKVNIYWVRLPDVPEDSLLKSHMGMLDAGELDVYYQYRVKFKRVEFLTGRVLLKKELGKLLGIKPNEVHFRINKYGKLFLDNYYFSSSNEVFFSISHSEKLVVCAITELDDIGIDVENTQNDYLEIMRNVYLQHEIDFVSSKESTGEKLFAFYLLWTRKEAFIKALGRGLSLSPLSFTVPRSEGIDFKDGWEYYSFQPLSNYLISTCIKKQLNKKIQYEVQTLDFVDLF